MTSSTTTQFKQKTCPKCKNNHNNEGVLCSFCIQAGEAAMRKVQRPPDHFWVKCLIEREGDTTLNLGNIQYVFKRNQTGAAVCEIINLGHYTQIVKSDFYEPYVLPVVVAPVTEEQLSLTTDVQKRKAQTVPDIKKAAERQEPT